jgi:O-antigen ligase
VSAVWVTHTVTTAGLLTTPAAAASGAGEAAEKLSVLVLAASLGVVVLGRPPRISERAHAAAMLCALVLTPVLLAVDVWNSSQLTHLRHHPLLAAAAAAAVVLVIAALALIVHRRPAAFALLAVLALPFRLPISAGGSTANLLVPLYLVVAAGALVYLRPRLFGRERPSASGTAPGPGSAPTRARDGAQNGWWDGGQALRRTARELLIPRGLQWLLMASVALYALQATYSGDFSKALQNIVFFYAPFALLFFLLREVRWSRNLLLGCAGVAIALAVIFASVGFIEYERQQLFLNPKLVQANQYGNYFRVNSVFFDPNIYGRFLALVMIVLTLLVLVARRRRDVIAGGVVLLWLWGGLITSFSESSMAALLLGLAVLAAWRWDTLTTVYAALAAGILALVVALAAPPSAHLGLSGEGGSANNATSGRANLISGGLALFADRPLQGFGSGSFALQYRRHHASTEETAVSASHTIPVTVAAEQGILGLLLYVALLVSAFAVLFAGAGRSPPRIALAACFAALVLHTWAYADFLEDPEVWTILGIGVALATTRRGLEGRLASPSVSRDLERAELGPELARL